MKYAELLRIRHIFRAFSLCVLLLTIATSDLWAQNEEPPAQAATNQETEERVTHPPRVTVIPPANRSGRPQYDTLSQTIADTIAFALRLLGDFTVRAVVPEEVEGVSIGDPSATAAYAAQTGVDYVVLGELDEETDGAITFEMGVWDQAAETITIRRDAAAESLFDTFDVADDLALELISALSGRRIAFGSVLLDLSSPIESFVVFVDGQYAAFGERRLDRIPAGERTIEVVPVSGTAEAVERVSSTIVVEPDASTTVALRVDAPGIPWLSPELIRYAGADESPVFTSTDGADGELPSSDGASGTGDAAETATGESAGDESSDETTEPGIPDWFEGGFNSGRNPDAALFDVPIIEEILSDGWYHEPVSWWSSAARFPLAEWRIDGSIDDWPWPIPYYPLDPRAADRSSPSVLQYLVAFSIDAIRFTVRFGGEWEAFLHGSEPHLYVEATMYGAGEPQPRIFNFYRRGGRWRGETRLAQGPAADLPFEPISDFRVDLRERRLELAIPIEELDGARFMEVTDISLEEYEGDALVEVYRSGPPRDPRYGRRRFE